MLVNLTMDGRIESVSPLRSPGVRRPSLTRHVIEPPRGVDDLKRKYAEELAAARAGLGETVPDAPVYALFGKWSARQDIS
jgi:hypothetical protein